MALNRGRLFAGALFAGAIFGGQQAVEPPATVDTAAVYRPGAGGSGGISSGGRGYVNLGHTWIEVHKAIRSGGQVTPVEVSMLGSAAFGEAEGSGRCTAVQVRPEGYASVTETLAYGAVEPVEVTSGSSVEVVEVGKGTGKFEMASLQYIDLDEILALIEA